MQAWGARPQASLACLGRPSTGGALDQRVRVPLDVEPERPPAVDVREVRRADPPKPVLLDTEAITMEPCHDSVHATRVPGQHDAFPDRKTFLRYLDVIAWESEGWIADAPTHMIYFNGSRFLGPC